VTEFTRHAMYIKGTFKRFRITTFDIQKQYVFHILIVRLKHLLSNMESASPQRRIIFYLWHVLV